MLTPFFIGKFVTVLFKVFKQLYSLHSLRFGNKYESHLTHLREVMGTLQHHDAITGTEKQAVSHDYIKMLTRSIKEAENPLGLIIG